MSFRTEADRQRDAADRAPNPRRWWILASLCLSMLVVGLDGTVLNVALNDIGFALRAGTGALQWIVDGYLVTLAVLMIPAGVLGDRLGRGRVLAGGLLVFVLASAAAAWTTSPGQLIAARAFMGAGASAVMPLALSIIPTVFSPEERRKAVAIVTAALGLGMPLGPLLAGWLLDHFWWGSTMLINVPVVTVALVAGYLLIPDTRDTGARALDLPGLILSAIGFTAVMYALISAPAHGWASAHVLVPLVAGAVLLAAFALVQRRSPAPLVDRRLARERMFWWPTIAIALATFALMGLLFIVPQFLQAVRGLDAMDTGLHLMPVMVALVVGSGLGPRAERALGLSGAVALGLLVTAAGFGLITTVPATGGDRLYAAFAAIGLGFGIAMPPAMDAMLGALPADQEGTGSALNNAVKQLSGALGVAILGMVTHAAFADAVAPVTRGLPAASRDSAGQSLQGAVAVAQHLPAATGDRLRAVAGEAFVTGMHHAALVSGTVCVVSAIVLAVALPGRARHTH